MRILVTDRFAEAALARLAAAGFEVVQRPGLAGADLAAAVSGVHAMLVRAGAKIDESILARADALLAIGRAGVGCEHIDLEACNRYGIAVMNTPGATAIATAERAIALMLALLHQVPIADRSVRAGRWDRRAFLAHEATDKILGVVGFGNVGRVVCDRARGLRMRVLACSPRLSSSLAASVGVEAVAIDELLARADIVSCHVGGRSSREPVLGRRELGLMRPGAWFVNTSRGYLIDEAALTEALAAGRLAGAALDVFATEPLPPDSKLRELDNVILSPHLGASSREGEARASETAASQVASFLRDGTVRNLVNAPPRFRHGAASL